MVQAAWVDNGRLEAYGSGETDAGKVSGVFAPPVAGGNPQREVDIWCLLATLS